MYTIPQASRPTQDNNGRFLEVNVNLNNGTSETLYRIRPKTPSVDFLPDILNEFELILNDPSPPRFHAFHDAATGEIKLIRHADIVSVSLSPMKSHL